MTLRGVYVISQPLCASQEYRKKLHHFTEGDAMRVKPRSKVAFVGCHALLIRKRDEIRQVRFT